MSLRTFTDTDSPPLLQPFPVRSSSTLLSSSRFPTGPQSLPDLVVFSHLRWDFVFQRPQHLLSRCATSNRVFFVEEPIFDAAADGPFLEIRKRGNWLNVVVPHLRAETSGEDATPVLRALTDELLAIADIGRFVSWYYTPMALPFTRHLKPACVVYDCMDELSLFQGAPPSLVEMEIELFRLADVVFTGGRTLYEHKKAHHSNIHAFPSSIDALHFGKARDPLLAEPATQRVLSGPKIGYYGVIDERMDLDLIAGLADARPDWNLILLGPVVKVDPARLPQAANIHYLGSQAYEDLPAYVKGWDAAILPFALNDSTRFISPTKTPEYLAAGVPVVSTSIRDVITPYGDQGLALIADGTPEFLSALEAQLAMTPKYRREWLQQVDVFLANLSWDATWEQMRNLIPALSQEPPANAVRGPTRLLLPAVSTAAAPFRSGKEMAAS